MLRPRTTADSAQIAKAEATLRLRLKGLGLSGSSVAVRGDDVFLTLPDVKNSQTALDELGQTGVLYFRPVTCEIPAYGTPTSSATTLAPTSGPGPTGAQLQQACSSPDASQIPSTRVSDDLAAASVILPDYTGTVRYVLGPADMSGTALSDATVEVDSTTSQYTVLVTFTSQGATSFNKLAASRYACYQQNASNPPFCSLEAMELDGVVQSAPTIQAASFNGTAVISGASSNPFTRTQASALALVLKYGSLPVAFVPVSVQPSG